MHGLRDSIFTLERLEMKFKLALALAAAMFVGSFTISTARADDYPDPACFRACVQQYQACLQATPDKAALCWAFRQQCLAGCGTFL
jgi:hypothetical protein